MYFNITICTGRYVGYPPLKTYSHCSTPVSRWGCTDNNGFLSLFRFFLTSRSLLYLFRDMPLDVQVHKGLYTAKTTELSFDSDGRSK